MIRVIAVIRPHKLEEVKTALGAVGATGITVTEARGCGAGPEESDWFSGKEYVIALPPRIKLEVVVPDDERDAVVDAILQSARTGQPGDGKIFILRELDAIRVRTGERGESAV